MRRTLLLIPHEIAGWPVFGFGWLLLLLVISTLGYLAWEARRTTSDRDGLGVVAAFQQVAGLVAIAAVILIWVIPRTELTNVDGQPVGVAIRGYGMFLMLAAATSVGLAAWRSERAGLGSDAILRLAPWTFIGGLFGARVFYVTQYYQDFVRPTWGETLAEMAAFNQGGLVVYGGFIGGFIASAIALRRHGTPFWRIGDVIIPCVFVGLLFGRLGCLMNGCCYGGECAPGPLAVRFPAGSQVYAEQLLSGKLLGIEGHTEPSDEGNLPAGQSRQIVDSVEEGSLAENAGVREGQTLVIALDPSYRDQVPSNRPAEEALPGAVLFDGERVLGRFSPQQLPARASEVWGTQIISSLFAAAMFFVLLGVEWWLHRRSSRDSPANALGGGSPKRGQAPGVLMLIGFIAYGLLRIVLEWIRVDETGQFGTSLSISQWVSLLVIAASLVALIVRWRIPVPALIADDSDASGESAVIG